MLSYRCMGNADLDKVLSIEQKANAYPWSLKQIQDGLKSSTEFETRAGRDILLACVNKNGKETIIAFAIYSWVLDELSLLNFCVSVKYQGQGYGKSLLKHLLERARNANKIKYFLEVRASNYKAIGLYEFSGFKKSGVRENYYPTINGREDAFLYCWE